MTTLQAIKRFVEQYRIELHDPGLARQLDSLDPERLRPADHRTIHDLERRLRPYKKFHTDNHFILAPKGTFQGPYEIARQVGNNLSISALDEWLLRHLGLIGPSGSGKTTFIRGLILQALENGVHVLILDPKDDSLHLAATDPRFLLISALSELNIVQKPSFLTLDEFTTMFVDTFGDSYYSGANQRHTLTAGIEAAYSDHDQPSLKDVITAIGRKTKPGTTWSAKDDISRTLNRLEDLSRLYPTPTATRRGITWEELFKHSLYLRALYTDHHTSFLYTLLIRLLFLHNKRKQRRDQLTHLLVNDEGNQFWKAGQNHIQGEPLLANLQGVFREFGLAMLFTSVEWKSLHPILKTNTFTLCSMNVAPDDARHLARALTLNSQQQDILEQGLPRGELIIRFGDHWTTPIHAKFPKIPIEKTVTTAQIQAAEERLNRLAPKQQPPALATNTTRLDREATSEPQDLPVKLTKAQEALLRAALDTIQTTTQAYRKAGLASQTGNSAKDTLTKLGLLRTERALVKAGRGGNATLLTPTREGYELLGRTPPKGTRGGDTLQHAWLIQTAHALLPNSHPEAMVGNKSIDLLLTYDPDDHEALANILDREFKNGELIALEFECSRPERTAPNNIQKNKEAGVDHTIIATLPKRWRAAQRIASEHPDTTTVNALELIDQLEENAS